MTSESREILRKWLDQDMSIPEGKFSLKRRRESVTADEVIAKMREVPWPDGAADRFGLAVVEMIEITIAEICNPETKGSA